MRIWFDVITPKQARLMASIAKSLDQDYVITVKGYRESVELLSSLGVKFIQLGNYSTESLKEKLLSYADRVRLLAEFAASYRPDFLISLSSPEAVRVAYGLTIRSISLNDSPHSYHVGRLTLPLSWRVVHPAAIPREEMLKLGASEDSLVPYYGVDEIAWVKDTLNGGSAGRELKVFIRPEETGASYLMGGRGFSTKLIDVALERGAEVLVKPRYEEQANFLKRLYGNRIMVIEGTIDTLDLFKRVTLVITGGGTMARESALLGTPSLCVFPLSVKLYVNDYLKEMGFPIWRASTFEEAANLVEAILRDPERYFIDTKPLLEKMEDPRDVIKRVLGM